MAVSLLVILFCCAYVLGSRWRRRPDSHGLIRGVYVANTNFHSGFGLIRVGESVRYKGENFWAYGGQKLFSPDLKRAVLEGWLATKSKPKTYQPRAAWTLRSDGRLWRNDQERRNEVVDNLFDGELGSVIQNRPAIERISQQDVVLNALWEGEDKQAIRLGEEVIRAELARGDNPPPPTAPEPEPIEAPEPVAPEPVAPEPEPSKSRFELIDQSDEP